MEPGRKKCAKRSKKKCRSVNKRPRYFFIVREVRGDRKINSCCTLLHVMTIFSVAEHTKNENARTFYSDTTCNIQIAGVAGFDKGQMCHIIYIYIHK